jgi:membrane associated rhomboid family serine protease
MRPLHPALPRDSWPLWLVTGLVILPEVLLAGADAGLWGTALWRPLAWQNGGFWAGLWYGWQPNYAAQPFTMILTYPLVHAGPGHAAGNAAGLWALGVMLLPRAGARGVLLAFAAGAIGGGVAFALLAGSPAPMVGASGAVFGLAGALWWHDTAAQPPGWRRAMRSGGLAALGLLINWPMAWMTPGGIAWQAHVGGALAGAALAMALNANGRPKAPV